MGSGIYIATAGAVAQSQALDVTANNVANAATPAFRGGRMVFSEALAQARSPDTQLVGAAPSAIDASSGALAATGNPLDLALDGEGYFTIETPQGLRYTRAGNFTLDDGGRLVNGDGLAVRGEDGELIIPPDASAIAVGDDGTISADGAVVGKLALARFAPNQLGHDGGNLLIARGQPQAGDPPKVVSGLLEASNVNVVRGVVDLVKVSRTYESLMRVIEGFSQIEQRAARDLGRGR
ncbi:MAG: flagellar basal-body rod protein FlgF [Kofleriaceae bacterium]|jgi:flagellar basal-body rod protein FlgF|nr:flagellar basal-body rod protein FlgF [Kofleriaceae bacterium]